VTNDVAVDALSRLASDHCPPAPDQPAASSEPPRCHPRRPSVPPHDGSRLTTRCPRSHRSVGRDRRAARQTPQTGDLINWAGDVEPRTHPRATSRHPRRDAHARSTDSSPAPKKVLAGQRATHRELNASSTRSSRALTNAPTRFAGGSEGLRPDSPWRCRACGLACPARSGLDVAPGCV